MANKIITNTSFITVTPMAVLVNGPLARISLITAMADEGERATKIVPNNKATTALISGDNSAINGIYEAVK